MHAYLFCQSAKQISLCRAVTVIQILITKAFRYSKNRANKKCLKGKGRYWITTRNVITKKIRISSNLTCQIQKLLGNPYNSYYNQLHLISV